MRTKAEARRRAEQRSVFQALRRSRGRRHGLIEAMLRAGLPGPRDETGEPPPPSPTPMPPLLPLFPSLLFSRRCTKLFVSTLSGAPGSPPCRDVCAGAGRKERLGGPLGAAFSPHAQQPPYPNPPLRPIGSGQDNPPKSQAAFPAMTYKNGKRKYFPACAPTWKSRFLIWPPHTRTPTAVFGLKRSGGCVQCKLKGASFKKKKLIPT